MAIRRILVIDDDPDVCAMLKQYLTREGYAVESAHTTQSAMSIVGQRRVDLIFLDVMLGEESGLMFASSCALTMPCRSFFFPHCLLIIIVLPATRWAETTILQNPLILAFCSHEFGPCFVALTEPHRLHIAAMLALITLKSGLFTETAKS